MKIKPIKIKCELESEYSLIIQNDNYGALFICMENKEDPGDHPGIIITDKKNIKKIISTLKMYIKRK